MKIPSYKQILKYTLAFGSVNGLNILIQLVRNKLVSVLIGPGGMGLSALYQSSIQLIQNSTNFGVPQSGVRTISQYFDEEEHMDEGSLAESIKLIRSWSLVTAILGGFVMLLCSPFFEASTFPSTHAIHLHLFSFNITLPSITAYLCLSPVVFFTAITAGEMAVLKATRKIKKVAILSVWTTLATLIIAAPIYYLYGTHGIIPVLVLTAIVQSVITVCYSYRLYPLSLTMKFSFLKKGKDMIQLGLAFVAAGIMGSGAEFLVRTYINNQSGTEMVGLYNAGFMMVMTYSGIALAALDSEYFPRISALCGNNASKSDIQTSVLKQVKVSLMIIIPMVIVMYLLLPWLIPLLFSNAFAGAVPMAQAALVTVVARGIMMPVEYLPLAKGDSLTYLTLEIFYDILLVLGVCVGYDYYGIVGAGLGLSFTSVCATIFDVIYLRWRYFR